MTAALVLVALLAGACWRRWWGDERPAWAFPGYRWLQAGAGVALLLGLGLLMKEPLWRAALEAALVIGWLASPIKLSLFGFTQFFLWLSMRVRLPRGVRIGTTTLPDGTTIPRYALDGYTTYAEAS